MKVELDEYEIWQLQYLIKDTIKEIRELPKISETTRKIDDEQCQMYSDILEKLKQAS